MRRLTHTAVLPMAAAVLAAPAPHAAALHDDDPKVLDQRPAYAGPGYRGAWVRDAGGNLVLQSPPGFFSGDGMSIQSWLPVAEFGAHDSANDCWGYVSPSGSEYAILGLSHGTAFVNIDEPGDPVIVKVVSGPQSLWRDIKVYGEHAYAVSEGGGGIQVITLEDIDAGVVTKLGHVTVGGTKATHNVAIDTTSGFLYRCGGNDKGLRIYDLSDPTQPAFAGEWSERYVHDAQVVTFTEGPNAGKQVAFCCTGFNGGFVQPGVHVLDVTDKQNIVELGFTQYGVPGYSHQAWLSTDQQYLYLNDEADEGAWGRTATHVLDVGELSNPVDLGVFLGPTTSIGHNLYTRDDGLLFAANYTSGVQVFDTAADPLQPPPVAGYDTWLGGDAQTYNGLWSVYPYFPSGTVIGSDKEKGLFVWWYGEPPLAFDYPEGLPQPVEPEGQPLSVLVTESAPGELVPGSVNLHYDVGEGFVTAPMSNEGGGLYAAQLPAVACNQLVRYFFSAESQNGVVWRGPEGSPAGAVQTVAALAETELYFDDVEQPNSTWSVGVPGDTAPVGEWLRANPEATDAQPGSDVSVNGQKCFVTGPYGGPGVGDSDVDGGVTTLAIGPLDLSGATEVQVSYWRWYSNDQGGVVDDSFVVDVSDDDGQSWVNAETLGPGHPEASGGWFYHGFRLRDFVDATSEVHVRWVASDTGGASIVEAAVDEFRITEVVCQDCNGNGVSDDYELETGAAQDLDGDGRPDDCDPLYADTLAISVSQGGTQSLFLEGGGELGGQLYWLLGTASGTEPGTPLGGEVLPINLDGYTEITLFAPNQPPLAASLGNLDAAGSAQASLSLPAASAPELVGLSLHHAYFAADVGLGTVLAVSNAVPLSLEP